MLARTVLFGLFCICCTVKAEVVLITEPRPGEEYVMVSGGGQLPLRGSRNFEFETSHKIPDKPRHTSRTGDSGREIIRQDKFTQSELSPVLDAMMSASAETLREFKRETGEGIIAIEEDKSAFRKESKKKTSSNSKKSMEIEIDVPVSKLQEIKIKDVHHDDESNLETVIDPVSISGKASEIPRPTTQNPVLTTAPPSTTLIYDVLPINLVPADSINSGLLSSNAKLETAGSEQKQHSRIQIKKGPNGQDYEYEYVYYYYDDDEESAKGTDAAPKSTSSAGATTTTRDSQNTNQKTLSSDQISPNNKNKSRYSSIDRSANTTTAAPVTVLAPESSQNEVVPNSSRNRFRGRNITPAAVQENLNEERLPVSTRFPPRSRQLNSESQSSETVRQSKDHDSVADESIGQTRSRTRANVRRPSSELVDLASFNTHSGDVAVSQYKEIQNRFNVEEKENEKQREAAGVKTPVSLADLEEPTQVQKEDSRIIKDDTEYNKQPTEPMIDGETTEYVTMTAMDKVALELYAYLAGENLYNEIIPTTDISNFELSTFGENDDASTTESYTTTEIPTTTPTTTTTTPAPTTTTTTTTTTTPAPTPTARGSRFKSKSGPRSRFSGTTTTTSETPVESSTKGRARFGGSRTGFTRGRLGPAPVEEKPVEEKQVKESSAGNSQSAPTGRSRFSSRSSTTSAPSSTAADSVASAAAAHAAADHSTPRLRLRPAFNLRERRPLPGATSATNATPTSDRVDSESVSPSSEAPQETASAAPSPSSAPVRGVQSRGRLPSIRPLRPGARLNIGGARGLTANVTPAAAASTEGSTPEPNTVAVSEHQDNSEQGGETTPAPLPANPLQRLRGRQRLAVSASPRPRATPAPRRANPLLGRRRPNAAAESEAAEVSEAPVTEAAEPAAAGSTSPDESNETPALSVAAVEDASTEAPAPRGLSSLLAGRRRMAIRRPGTIL